MTNAQKLALQINMPVFEAEEMLAERGVLLSPDEIKALKLAAGASEEEAEAAWTEQAERQMAQPEAEEE